MTEIIRGMADNLGDKFKILQSLKDLSINWPDMEVGDGVVVDRKYHDAVRTAACRQGKKLKRFFQTRVADKSVYVVRTR